MSIERDLLKGSIWTQVEDLQRRLADLERFARQLDDEHVAVVDNLYDALNGEALFDTDNENEALLPGALVVGPQDRGAQSIGLADFRTSTSSTTTYIHIKLPFTNVSDHYYCVQAIGGVYNSTVADVVLITWTGLIAASGGAPIRTNTFDAAGVFAATQYVGSDTYIYLRFKPANIRFLSFVVNAVQVDPDDDPILPGTITITASTSATL